MDWPIRFEKFTRNIEEPNKILKVLMKEFISNIDILSITNFTKKLLLHRCIWVFFFLFTNTSQWLWSNRICELIFAGFANFDQIRPNQSWQHVDGLGIIRNKSRLFIFHQQQNFRQICGIYFVSYAKIASQKLNFMGTKLSSFDFDFLKPTSGQFATFISRFCMCVACVTFLCWES